jgi:uncharacterized protein
MFVDTSGWFSIFDSKEVNHQIAASLYGSAERIITHSYVLAEFVALSEARKKHRSEMLTFLYNLVLDADIQVIWVDDALTLRAMNLLRTRIDKKWSLCDAVSFRLMENLRLTDALTTDRHFEQAGFVKLLNS